MLGGLGLIDGITATIVIVLGIINGCFFYYQSIKREARMLKQLALASIFAGLLYLGVFLDFLYVLSTGTNLSNPPGLVALLSYIWFAPVMLCAVSVGFEFRFKEKKKYFLGLYLILGAIYTILIFLDPIGSFDFDNYAPEGEGLIDYNIKITSIAGIFMISMLAPIIIFIGFGSLRFGKEAAGMVRKQFIFLACGIIGYGIFGMLEGFTQPGVAVIIIRIGYISSFWFMYASLSQKVD